MLTYIYVLYILTYIYVDIYFYVLYIFLYKGINQELLDTIFMPTDKSEVSELSMVLTVKIVSNCR